MRWPGGVSGGRRADTSGPVRGAAAGPYAGSDGTRGRSVSGYYDDYRRSMKAWDYSAETLRHHLVSRNWMVGVEAWSGAVLNPVTYNLEQHDRLLMYLREERKLAPNTVCTAIKGLKSFLCWLRDGRGVLVALELRKLVTKPFDAPKLYLSAGDLEQLVAVLLPANLVATRDMFLFCCYTGLRYSDVVALHAGNLHVWDEGRLLRLI